TLTYTVENRGGAAAGPFSVEVRLSPDDTIDGADVLLYTFTVPGLAPGAAARDTLTLTLPGTSPFPRAGPTFVGLRLVPGRRRPPRGRGRRRPPPGHGLRRPPRPHPGTRRRRPLPARQFADHRGPDQARRTGCLPRHPGPGRPADRPGHRRARAGPGADAP